MKKLKKIIVVGGLTASGKTKLAVEIAKKFNGELVNADSRQIYRRLNIGTNKETSKKWVKTDDINNPEEVFTIDDIPVHLVDLISPSEVYNLYDYQQIAFKTIDEILSRDKLPILVGGTGLYIDAIIKNYRISESAQNNSIREELSNKSLDELQKLIPTVELQKLNNSDKNNPRRLIRVIEKLEIEDNLILDTPRYEVLFLYPDYNWNDLKSKIDKRVVQMFRNGLINEIKYEVIYGDSNYPGLKIMGYAQAVKYIKGEIDLNTAIELTQNAHKHYAKRQRTWFEGEGRGYDLKRVKNSEEAGKLVQDFLQ